MRRREFIAGLGSAVAWPLMARANDIRPRIAVLTMNAPQDDARRVASFVNGLHSLGYVEHQTVEIDYRYADGDIRPLRRLRRN